MKKLSTIWCARSLLAPLLLLSACATTATRADKPAEEARSRAPQEGEDFYELPKDIPRGAPILEGGESGLQREAVVLGEAPPVSLEVAEFAIARKDLEAFLKQGPQHALRLLRIQPAFSGSRFLGYEIMGFMPESAAALRQRLREGDIIVSVNQQSIARPEDYMSVWNKLSSHHDITVTVLRAGEELDLVWPIIDPPAPPAGP